MRATLLGLVAQLLHIALMLAAAPLLEGTVRHLRARLAGHAGPSPLQPWRDLRRLARKQPVVAEEASALSMAAPTIDFAASLSAAALVPGFILGMTSAPVADLLLLAGLLMLSYVVRALAAMDTGTALGGVGASRAMAVATLAAPALLLAIFALALAAGSTNLDAIARFAGSSAGGRHAMLGLVLAALLPVALAAALRRPIDDARTQAEPAMIGAALHLECSGWHLALVAWAASLRLLTLLSLLVAAVLPFGVADIPGPPLGWLIGLVAWGGKIAVLALALAVLETAAAPLPLRRVPAYLGVAVVLGLLAVVLLCVGQGVA